MTQPHDQRTKPDDTKLECLTGSTAAAAGIVSVIVHTSIGGNRVRIRVSNEFDGVIDFDGATRDPAHPTRFLPAYDSGDHLHPNDLGYQVMGNAVSLTLFRSLGVAAKPETGLEK